jgi:hypothetical protein
VRRENVFRNDGTIDASNPNRKKERSQKAAKEAKDMKILVPSGHLGNCR